MDNPLSLNLYTYVNNNPLTHVDPTGHVVEGSAGEGGSAKLTNWQYFTIGLKMFVREGVVGPENYDTLTDGEFTSGDIAALAQGGVYLSMSTEGKFFSKMGKIGEGTADNIADFSKLKEQLKNEEFTSLFKDGSLHPDVVSKSTAIIPGEKLKDVNVVKALTKDGSSMSDWAKMESPTYASPFGDFKFHFYQNLKTGEVSPFDNKMKMNGQEKSYIYPEQMYP
ncbi:hypothetical protein BC351_18430 [Paenibacillus ferrarius]|uniref:Pre-toxin TG domain-containing protein n=1 Tax=Paenibacillus ferrarius TaxID=1469647 RepID=A0A1V4HRM2_9BACL|nr:hypothetical protein [Paenibacillus ferrarius]OPH60466.1 hypothetical protein BC351_18430 [Paenibacillus ferrarius]